ncbi:MAG TPA: tail fiber domain-containing protein [Blastocatellia bacterium]|nr:tail fiber domain-containing protein [Blastocatellia bacterium]
MSAKKLFLMISVVVMFVTTTSASGQTSSFTYQGKLTDGTAAANGTYQMTFTLFDSATNGIQIGIQNVNNSVSVSQGVFTVRLDFGVPAFSGADRWLEVAAKKPGDPTFTVLSPRQQITSAPYAITAANVNTTSGNNVINAINDAATSTTINDARLPASIVRLEPAATQVSPGVNPLLNLSTSASLLKYIGDGGFLVTGTAGSGAVPTTGAGTRMMWYPGKMAFRAGQVSSFGAAYWDNANIGNWSVAFGENTQATNDHAFAAGLATTASGTESVALGNNGTATGDRSFAFNGTATGVGAIAMGSGAQATNDDSTALGPSSIASGLASIAVGPCQATGAFATCIGLEDFAEGNFSTVLGKNVSTCSTYNCSGGSTVYTGVIALGDGSAGFLSDGMTATANNQFNVRAAGGIRFFTSCCTYSAGVTVAAGGGSWSSISDRNMKENFIPVNSREVLRGVLRLPISTWNYKTQAPSIRHMGAMAQDFYRTFKIGENDKSIATIDPDGVAFAAIQGLYEEIKDRDQKIQQQQDQLSAMQKQLKQQQSVIESLRKAICSQNPQAEICR